VLQEEVSLCSKGKRRDSWVGAKESLVVTVIGDAVCARSVVVDEAEVKLATSCGFGGDPEIV
jgi:hypothetical protein